MCVEPKFLLLVIGVSGTFSGEDFGGQANRRTAAAHLLGRIRRGHHVRRSPASLKKCKARRLLRGQPAYTDNLRRRLRGNASRH